MDDVYELIRRAILERKQVYARFDSRLRKFCPHALGTRDGQPRSLVFQFGGFSSRGLPPGGDWRCLLLHRLSDVELREGRWWTRPHSQPQRCIEEVDLSIVP